MRIAIIGTRTPSMKMYNKLVEFAYDISQKGIQVSTGCADGSDKAAREGTIKSNVFNLHIYLPNKDKTFIMPKDANMYWYDKSKHPEWTRSVIKYHPSKGNLPRESFNLHARNYGIIADPVVNAVIALPKSLTDLGGTGQGIRIAEDLGIPVYNLIMPGTVERVEEWIKTL